MHHDSTRIAVLFRIRSLASILVSMKVSQRDIEDLKELIRNRGTRVTDKMHKKVVKYCLEVPKDIRLPAEGPRVHAILRLREVVETLIPADRGTDRQAILAKHNIVKKGRLAGLSKDESVAILRDLKETGRAPNAIVRWMSSEGYGTKQPAVIYVEDKLCTLVKAMYDAERMRGTGVGTSCSECILLWCTMLPARESGLDRVACR
jgi:hypothetical protein